MREFSDRHSRPLRGVVVKQPAQDQLPRVGIRVPAAQAQLATAQHTAWMLANILVRFVDIIGSLQIECEADAKLATAVCPLAPEADSISQALLLGARAVGGVDVQAGIGDADLVLEVGFGRAPAGGLRVFGSGWWGEVSTGGLRELPDSSLPFGPYAAACLAASQVFLLARLAEPPPLRDAGFSMWQLAAASAPSDKDLVGELPAHRELDAALAGCGAVGSAWLHAIWATPGLLGSAVVADDDADGLIESNLNRCPLFGQEDLGSLKADAAGRRFASSGIAIDPYNGKLSHAQRRQMVISAVDTGASRRSIQRLYPGRLLQASTQDLRAELLRCDPRSAAACLACFTQPDDAIPDVEVRRRFLDMNRDEQQQYAASEGLRLEEAVRWAVEGTCSTATDRLMEKLRPTTPTPAAFAVGFVSVMAGTMLAAQTVRELAGLSYPFDGVRCRAALTLMNPMAATNRVSAFQREPICAACSARSAAMKIWSQRYADYGAV